MTAQPKKELLILCEKCAENIPESQFKKHKIEHQLGKLPEEAELINPATGKPDGEPLALPEAPVVTKKTPEKEKPTPSTSEPISLKYIFKGTCPTCNEVVKTIELEGIPEKDKTTVVAYCIREDKNIQQRIVARI